MEHKIGFRQPGQVADHAQSVTYLFVVVAYMCTNNTSLKYWFSK